MESKHPFSIVRLTPLWFALSAAVIVPGLISMMVQGMNWGIDFRGGALFEYRLTQPVKPGEESTKMTATARRVLREVGLQKSEIQLSDGNRLIIRTDARDSQQSEDQKRLIQGGLEKQFGKLQFLGTELVGPVIGRELKKKALVGTLLGCLGILLYVTIRYEFRFAVAGVAALLHDVLVMGGLLSLLRVEVNSPFVAALLTVVGYSINDTVVIFDRIRENLKLRRRDPFDAVVEDSLWQTMARSINTVLTVELTLLALFFFGGATIHDFALALLIGVTTGAYSSIFTASPIVVLWRNASDRRRRVAVPQRGARQIRPAPKPVQAARAAAPTPTVTAGSPPASLGEETEQETVGTEPAVEAAASGAEAGAAARRKPTARKIGKSKRRH